MFKGFSFINDFFRGIFLSPFRIKGFEKSREYYKEAYG